MDSFRDLTARLRRIAAVVTLASMMFAQAAAAAPRHAMAMHGEPALPEGFSPAM
jgi:hypothetical protein